MEDLDGNETSKSLVLLLILLWTQNRSFTRKKNKNKMLSEISEGSLWYLLSSPHHALHIALC